MGKIRNDRVLLVSTDPASNLDDVLATPVRPGPTVIPGVPGLGRTGTWARDHAADALADIPSTPGCSSLPCPKSRRSRRLRRRRPTLEALTGEDRLAALTHN
jgi:hypothetical protein